MARYERDPGAESYVKLEIGCRNLIKMDATSASDPLVLVHLRKGRGMKGQFKFIGRTELVINEHNPRFQRLISVPVSDKDEVSRAVDIRLDVYDGDPHKHKHRLPTEDRLMGSCIIPLATILQQERVEEVLTNVQSPGRDRRLREKDSSIWVQEVSSGPGSPGGRSGKRRDEHSRLDLDRDLMEEHRLEKQWNKKSRLGPEFNLDVMVRVSCFPCLPRSESLMAMYTPLQQNQ